MRLTLSAPTKKKKDKRKKERKTKQRVESAGAAKRRAGRKRGKRIEEQIMGIIVVEEVHTCTAHPSAREGGRPAFSFWPCVLSVLSLSLSRSRSLFLFLFLPPPPHSPSPQTFGAENHDAGGAQAQVHDSSTARNVQRLVCGAKHKLTSTE